MFSPHSPPQSLLYKKYINDCTKSGEIHHKAIENFENHVIVYEQKLVKICTSRCVFIYKVIKYTTSEFEKLHSIHEL